MKTSDFAVEVALASIIQLKSNLLNLFSSLNLLLESIGSQHAGDAL